MEDRGAIFSNRPDYSLIDFEKILLREAILAKVDEEPITITEGSSDCLNVYMAGRPASKGKSEKLESVRGTDFLAWAIASNESES